MLRSFLGRKWVLASLAIATTLAFSAVVVPALGGPSLKQLVKKEVKRQLKGKVGPQGPQGPPGANGATSPSAASFDAQSGNTAVDTVDTQYLSVDITLASSSLVEANAMLALSNSTGTPAIQCWIKLDGADISSRSQVALGSDTQTETVVGAANDVPAGTHTVTAGCKRNGAGDTNMTNGNLNVIAVG